MNIDYNIQIWKERDQYVAHAMPLDVMSCGKDPDDAKESLKEAVYLFIETAKDMGTLEDILDECGYESREQIWTGPRTILIENQSLAFGV